MNKSLLKHYAQAFFSLGKEENKVEVFKTDLELFSHVFQKTPETIKFLSSPMVTEKEKDQLLESNFKGKVDLASLGLVKVMIKKKVISHYQEIFTQFNHLYNEETGVLEGRVYTPFELSKKTLSRLEQVFTEKYQRKVVLKVLIDKKVIAGMRVYIQDTLYDYSVDTKLNQVKNKLVLPD